MKTFLRFFLSTLILCLFFSEYAFASQGKVVGVGDGDTITIMINGRKEKIRLYGVDCPESMQAFGQRAKQFTSAMVFGKIVTVTTGDTDDYGRTVGIVTIDGACLNEELIRNGMAWLYRHFCDRPFCNSWSTLEESAKANRFGIWSQPNPVAPWVFRHSGNKEQQFKRFPEIPVGGGPFHGNISSRVFHAPTCTGYNCKSCTMVFKRRDEALAARYRPCGKCRP